MKGTKIYAVTVISSNSDEEIKISLDTGTAHDNKLLPTVLPTILPATSPVGLSDLAAKPSTFFEYIWTVS